MALGWVKVRLESALKLVFSSISVRSSISFWKLAQWAVMEGIEDN